MADLFSKVSEILSNPESAQKIREIAASLSSSAESSEPDRFPEDSDSPALPAVESSDRSGDGLLALSGLGSGLSSGFGSHSRELALLNAVRPYLRASRAGKIDNAMKAIRVIDMLSGLR